MEDIQNHKDYRNIDIDQVGVKGISYPITVLDRDQGEQQTVAEINMYVDLPRYYKGTHMSRFVEILNEHSRRISPQNFSGILEEMKTRLDAESAHMEITFPYFINKYAPVTGAEGLMEYKCTMKGSVNRGSDLVIGVHVPISTLCPCSKEISDFGAHNQRGEVRLRVRFKKFVWIEDLIKLVEASASSDVFSVLKREDEKYVTEKAYQNPMFVEDIVREIAVKLGNDPNITWFAVESENFESIHNHNAYACIERRKAQGARSRVQDGEKNMTDLKKMYRTVMDDHFPPEITISFGDQVLAYRKRSWKIPDEKSEIIEKGLRYGENPGQEAALYELVNGNLVLGECQFIEPGSGLVSAITEEDMLQSGKHPGKINLTDVDNALNIMKYLDRGPAVVIVKHNNPCGVAYGAALVEAYEKADMADRIAAFGGCALFNRPVDLETAERVSENYLEVVAAPDFEEGSLEILSKRGNLRIIRIPKMDRLPEYAHKRFVDFKSLIDGGIILQQSPTNRIGSSEDFTLANSEYHGRTYTIERKPSDEEYGDMLFGWQVEQGVTSNSVIYVKDGVTVGIGTGEQDRVGVAEIGIFKAYTKCADAICFSKHHLSYNELKLMVEKGEKEKTLIEEVDQETRRVKGGLLGASMVSDAFFPFRDGVDVGIRQGVRAIVHPGGSMRDFEVIEACNEADPKVTMVFTGQRAFKH